MLYENRVLKEMYSEIESDTQKSQHFDITKKGISEVLVTCISEAVQSQWGICYRSFTNLLRLE